VTIDGADARDFDDAVFAEALRGGGWRLVVAIADVSHYVRVGSELDTWKRARDLGVFSRPRAADAAGASVESLVLADAARRALGVRLRHACQQDRQAQRRAFTRR
jgi:hypothetical protein